MKSSYRLASHRHLVQRGWCGSFGHWSALPLQAARARLFPPAGARACRQRL